MSTRTRLILWLAVLAVIDVVIPVPITALIVLYAILERPPWARRAVAEIFGA